jgi:fructose transport system ATP-binding protein
MIRRVRDKGLPVILISHNMPHVFEIADRIHVARLGRRAAILNPKKIGPVVVRVTAPGSDSDP